MYPKYSTKKRKESLIRRFIAKIGAPDENGCWPWLGGILKSGYGEISGYQGERRSMLRASRVSWELFVGPIPDGLWVLHHCDNRKCVNPAHLFLGTHTDNMRDMVQKGRHMSVVKPEALHRGDKHWTRRMPERVARGYRNGAWTKPEMRRRGSTDGMSKITEDDAREIRRLSADGMTYKQIGELYGMYFGNVGKIVRRELWSHVP